MPFPIYRFQINTIKNTTVGFLSPTVVSEKTKIPSQHFAARGFFLTEKSKKKLT
jgi:hypothetical protein